MCRLNTFPPPRITRIPPEHHKIIKTHRILIILKYFIGNYVACKNYTQKEKNLFIHLMRSHFSLIAKTYVAIGTCCLRFFTVCTECGYRMWISTLVFKREAKLHVFLFFCLAFNSQNFAPESPSCWSRVLWNLFRDCGASK